MQYNMYQEYNLKRNVTSEIWVIMEFNFLSLSDQQLIKLSDAIRRERLLDTNIRTFVEKGYWILIYKKFVFFI